MAIVPFIDLGFGIANLVTSIRKAKSIKKEIATIKQGMDVTKKSLKDVRTKARAAGLDLGTANQHSRLADEAYNGLHTALLALQAAAPGAGVTKIKNSLLAVQKDFVAPLLNEDASLMQETPVKNELVSAKGDLRNHFNAITAADDRDSLLKAVQLAVQDCISIAGVRNAFFSRLGNELATV